MERINPIFNLEVKKSGATSERASLVEYFVENVRTKQGKKYSPPFIGMKLSHLSISDLYYMKSQAEEYSRKPGGSVGRYFFGSLKNN